MVPMPKNLSPDFQIAVESSNFVFSLLEFSIKNWSSFCFKIIQGRVVLKTQGKMPIKTETFTH